MFIFNPDRVAAAEAAGWRAYYDRDWPRLLGLIVSLSEAQFRIPLPISWLAAYHIVRASAAWAPLHHDLGLVRRHLERYYRIARRYSGLRFDPARAAQLEVRYWDVHRRLSMTGQADKAEFVEALTDLHAELFGLPPEQARESAEWRVRANNTVDAITGGTSADPAGDWRRLEEHLRQCYFSLARALARRAEVVPA